MCLPCIFYREKYLNTLIQVEMMLKLWFPQIQTQPVSAASSVATSPARSLQDTTSSTPPHKHRDQLHIPVKVRKHTNNPPPLHQHHQHCKLSSFFTGKLLPCSFSRSADSAGQVRTPLHLPLCFSSALASVQKRGGWSKIMIMMKVKGTTVLLHLPPLFLRRWRLMRTKICQTWPVTVSEMRTQRERIVTARKQASYQSRTKQVKALSRAWRGCTSPQSCPHENPAPHMRVQQQQVLVKISWSPPSCRPAGGVVLLRKTASSLLPHLTSTPKI